MKVDQVPKIVMSYQLVFVEILQLMKHNLPKVKQLTETIMLDFI